MTSRRQNQVAEEVNRVLSNLLLREREAWDLPFLTITRVAVSADFSFADIWVSFINKKDEGRGMEKLDRQVKWLRGEIGKKVILRRVPELRFHLDTSGEFLEKLGHLG